MKTRTLKIHIYLFFCAVLLACNQKPIDINFEYPTHQSEKSSTSVVKVNTEKIVLVFWDGFNSDIVKVELNGHKVYQEKLMNKVPISGSFEIKREKKNILQIYINGQKTKKFEFEEKFDCGVITWNKKGNEINFTYDNMDGMAGFD